MPRLYITKQLHTFNYFINGLCSLATQIVRAWKRLHCCFDTPSAHDDQSLLGRILIVFLASSSYKVEYVGICITGMACWTEVQFTERAGHSKRSHDSWPFALWIDRFLPNHCVRSRFHWTDRQQQQLASGCAYSQQSRGVIVCSHPLPGISKWTLEGPILTPLGKTLTLFFPQVCK